MSAAVKESKGRDGGRNRVAAGGEGRGQRRAFEVAGGTASPNGQGRAPGPGEGVRAVSPRGDIT